MNSGLRLAVRLTPKGGRDAIDGWYDAPDGRRYLKARVSAVAEDGKANDALRRLIAKELNIGATHVRIVSGAASRMKVIELDGVTALPARFGEPA